MSMQFFDTPSSRAKFERNLHLLAETMRQGKLRIASGASHTIDGIQRVRVLPNRRIDLLTVDESTRLTANTLAWAMREKAVARGNAGPDEEDRGTAPERGEDEE